MHTNDGFSVNNLRRDAADAFVEDEVPVITWSRHGPNVESE